MMYDGVISKPSIDEIVIEHHGIKGMKWGVRHDYVPVGGSRGSVVQKPKKRGKIYNYNYNRYRKMGISEEESEKLAEKRAKITKIALGVAGVSIAALAGYAAYRKFGPEYLDTTLRKGTKLQTLSMNKDRGNLGDLFAAYKNKDKSQYKAQFGKEGMGTGSWLVGDYKFNIQNKIKEKTKIASPHNSEKIYKKLMDTNPEFRKAVRETIGQIDSQIDPFGKDKGYENGDPSYRKVNLALVMHPSWDKTFYSELKKAGYGGLIDYNDQKGGGGLQAQAPVIIFDKSKYVADTIKKLTKEDMSKAAKDYAAREAVSKILDKATSAEGIQLGSLGIITGAAVAVNAKDAKNIKEAKQNDKKKKKAG